MTEPVDDADALRDAEFSQLMERLGDFRTNPAMAVACSGGPDSMALVHCLSFWCRERSISLTALIVDHQLRPESTAEAAAVQKRLAAIGVVAVILPWEGEKPESDIQSLAREARYALMSDWCAAHGIDDLFLGHHMDDQAETFLMRLARGSGVDGLKAMTGTSLRSGLRLRRPFLAITKDRLIARLEDSGLPYVEDPSNSKPEFARVRLRGLMPALAAEGLDARTLSDTATRMARASLALEFYTQQHLASSGRLFHAGYVRLVRNSFLDAPEDILLRCLSRLVAGLGGAGYPPRLEKLQTLLAALKAGDDGRTLGGCQFSCRNGLIWIARELAATAPAVVLKPGSVRVWDGRYKISLPVGERPAEGAVFSFGAMGEEGWRQWRKKADDLPGYQGMPVFVRRALPALWQGRRLLYPMEAEKSDHGQGYGIVQIHLMARDFFGKTTFSSPLSHTM